MKIPQRPFWIDDVLQAGRRTESPSCPKCGQQLYGPLWLKNLDKLRWNCACGYSMKTLTLDRLERGDKP